ncbi:hypothetical protein Hanom_Chr08g00742511 [Helianthus anomalus]
MELTSQMKMVRFQTFWIQMRKNKPLDESRKSSQTSGTKMAFNSIRYIRNTCISRRINENVYENAISPRA